VVLFGSLLVIGVSAPVATPREPTLRLDTVAVAAIGCAAFVISRMAVDGDAVAAAVPRIVGLNTLAAVAEEAFFRRLVYGVLTRWGTVVAVVGSAALFAVVHVTVYGWWVLPIDLAAGLLFSWQRWATGSWVAPAITHSVANLLAVL
jgi:membrane protease YdiL (CAAX protease family)